MAMSSRKRNTTRRTPHRAWPLVLVLLVGACRSSGSGSGGGDAPSTSDAAASSDDLRPTAGSGTGTGQLPNGERCDADAECESGICWITDVDQRCSECSTDADCTEGGSTRPNFIAPVPDPIMASCNEGGLGDECTGDGACSEGLVCAFLFDIPVTPFAPEVHTCSECDSDGDCATGQLCAPVYDQANVPGHRACVAPASVPVGGGCDFTGSGDEACASGFCALAETQDLGETTTWPAFGGLCSECLADSDCPGGATCLPVTPQFALGDGLKLGPGVCAS